MSVGVGMGSGFPGRRRGGRATPLDEGGTFAVFWSRSSQARLSIRLDLTSGDRIGPGKIALLEAIRSTGSISAAARRLGMSYRRAWLLVEQINDALQEPAVTAAIGGRQGGGAALTPSGERVVELYRSIETIARASAKDEFRAVGKLVRKGRALRA
jgi:molybdate transport system regulatory protein